MKNEYTPQQMKEAVEMYEADAGIETIIRLFGGSRTGWQNRFRQMGLKDRERGRRPERDKAKCAEVVRMRNDGARFSEIAKRFSITRQRAQQIYARETAEQTPDGARRARREEILRQYRAGIRAEVIVRDCGLKNVQALRSLAYRWGVTRR